MTTHKMRSSSAVLVAAERELRAFLSATVKVDDLRGQTRVGHTWIDVFESQDLPDAEFKTFFRKVTILTIQRLQEGREQPGRQTSDVEELSLVY